MSKALEGLSLGLTEADITAIAKKHQEEHGMEIASWESQVELELSYYCIHLR